MANLRFFLAAPFLLARASFLLDSSHPEIAHLRRELTQRMDVLPKSITQVIDFVREIKSHAYFSYPEMAGNAISGWKLDRSHLFRVSFAHQQTNAMRTV